MAVKSRIAANHTSSCPAACPQGSCPRLTCFIMSGFFSIISCICRICSALIPMNPAPAPAAAAGGGWLARAAAVLLAAAALAGALLVAAPLLRAAAAAAPPVQSSSSMTASSAAVLLVVAAGRSSSTSSTTPSSSSTTVACFCFCCCCGGGSAASCLRAAASLSRMGAAWVSSLPAWARAASRSATAALCCCSPLWAWPRRYRALRLVGSSGVWQAGAFGGRRRRRRGRCGEAAGYAWRNNDAGSQSNRCIADCPSRATLQANI